MSTTVRGVKVHHLRLNDVVYRDGYKVRIERLSKIHKGVEVSGTREDQQVVVFTFPRGGRAALHVDAATRRRDRQ